MKKYGKRLRLSQEEVEMVYENRAESTTNLNGNTALDIHLSERGIPKKDVVSVKHWQSASGEYRFSVVTKEDVTADTNDMLEKISGFIENHSPHYPSVKRKNKNQNHLLVVNPADIHIGKYANGAETGSEYDVETACTRVLEGLRRTYSQSQGRLCYRKDIILHRERCFTYSIMFTIKLLLVRFKTQMAKWWEHFEVALALYVKVCRNIKRNCSCRCYTL